MASSALETAIEWTTLPQTQTPQVYRCSHLIGPQFLSYTFDDDEDNIVRDVESRRVLPACLGVRQHDDASPTLTFLGAWP